jgi:RNA polymerase sigma-70 factor (ECF subfamily)
VGLSRKLPHITGGVIAASAKEDPTALDVDGFVALVEPLVPSAYRLAVAMLRSYPDAEDAVQEAMFKAWRSFGKFRPEAGMKPWLLAIVANECRGQRRNRWSSVLRFANHDELASLTAAEPDPEASDLRRALYRLPYDQRLVLVLRYYLDLSFEEVAAVSKTTIKAAKSRVYRALERLRVSPEVIADE